MPRAGIEPARPFRAKGFSYHYGFRHPFRFVVWTIPSPWNLIDSLGVSCLVSAPSSFQRLGSRLPSALPGKVSLNLRHSTSLLSESALNFCRLDIRITVGGCFCVELATKTGEKQKNNATLTKIMAWKADFVSRRQGHGPAPVIRMSKSSHKSLVSTIPPPRRLVGTAKIRNNSNAAKRRNRDAGRGEGSRSRPARRRRETSRPWWRPARRRGALRPDCRGACRWKACHAS